MKNQKMFLLVALPLLISPLLNGCNQKEEPWVLKRYEIGETVKEWKSNKDFNALPLEPVSNDNTGEIVKDFGNEDKSSLKYTVKSVASTKSYLSSDIKKPYFKEDDAKNGDIVSLYFYAPIDSNLASLQLQLYPISMNNPIKGTLTSITADNQNQWVRLTASFDTQETLGDIRLVYTVSNTEKPASFYVDNINITFGEETVKTDYKYNNESLSETYKDYFKVGSCMSANMLQNTTIRQIAKDNFNTLTAENEAKPERILDQDACQKLAKGSDAKAADETAVAIKTSPFRKLYDFCEAYHIGVRHHTFVWFDQTPAWFFNEGYKDNGNQVSKEVMLKRMENFIKITIQTVNKRWPGLVYAIDVANEAVNNHTVRSDNNNWYNVIGKDFVYYAFKYTRMYANKNQKLFYNDYSFDYDTQNCTFALNTLLKRAIQEKLIDGVGIQGHIDSDQDMSTVMNDAKMIYKKGLECQFTELDITISGTSTSDLNKQKKAYNTLITKILKANIAKETNITGVIVWGINDGASWKRGQNPLLFTDSYAKKPAYYGFLEAINSVLPKESDNGSSSN